MAVEFMPEDFLLQNKTARILYHEHAKKMPIYDYHCHLPADKIAADQRFDNLTQIWLYGDHYKWRAMRANGVDERYCTGDASDYEKFEKWAQTVPCCLRNPLYHWSHLELKNPFGIKDKLLNPSTAKEIYETCSEMLRTPGFSVRNILRKMNVKLICTTEEPLDSLEHHKKIRADSFEIRVHTAWRPNRLYFLHCSNPQTAQLFPRKRLPAFGPRHRNGLCRRLYRTRNRKHLHKDKNRQRA